MAAIDSDTLLSEAKCYECYGPLTQAELLSLALERRWLLSLSPGANVTPAFLVDYAKCFGCLGASMYDLMELALLDQIAQLS